MLETWTSGPFLKRNAEIDYYLQKEKEYGDLIHAYDDSELNRIYSMLPEREIPVPAGSDREQFRELNARAESLCRELIQKHSDFVASHPGIKKSREGFQIASLRFPCFCSLSFTDQFRAGVTERISEALPLRDAFEREELTRRCGRVLLAPVGLTMITGCAGDQYCSGFYDHEKQTYCTYFQSMLIMPWDSFLHRELPSLLPFWVRAVSRSAPGAPVLFNREYPEGDLEFEILTETPRWFRNDFGDLRRFERDLYRESNDKKYFRTFLGDANAWRDWLIPCLRQIYLPKPKQG